MSRYRIYIEGVKKYVEFVDRDLELDNLRVYALKGYAFPITVYGPEGCGKTTLMRYFIDMLSEERDFLAIYIDALELRDLRRALFSRIDELYSLARSIASELPIGRALAEQITELLRRLHERRSLRGKKLVIVLDDVYRAIGLDRVELYAKSMYEWISYLHTEYDVENVLLLLLTSEGESKDLLYRHTYVHVYMVWNLPRRGFEELVEQLNPPKNIDIEELWRSTGGNPRALIELAQLD